MGKALIHEGGLFFEWSSVVDAPTTEAMNRAEAMAYCRRRYPELTTSDISNRLDRAERRGTSALGGWLSKEGIAEYNRAGPNEEYLPWRDLMRLVGIIEESPSPSPTNPASPSP